MDISTLGVKTKTEAGEGQVFQKLKPSPDQDSGIQDRTKAQNLEEFRSGQVKDFDGS